MKSAKMSLVYSLSQESVHGIARKDWGACCFWVVRSCVLGRAVACVGRAVACDCGTPWTFLLLFFFSSLCFIHFAQS